MKKTVNQPPKIDLKILRPQNGDIVVVRDVNNDAKFRARILDSLSKSATTNFSIIFARNLHDVKVLTNAQLKRIAEAGDGDDFGTR